MDSFGVNPNYRFMMWDWVGGRYSLWSSIGVSLAIAIGRDAFGALLAVLLPSLLLAAEWQAEWERTLAAARKEGTLVVGIPASSELRKAIGTKFKDRFGFEAELFPSRGPENVTRIIKEHTAGVRYFDILVAGGATPLSMVAAGAADDFQPYLILPEVKEAKNWWGGHIWEDNVSTKRYIYAFLCYTSETFWSNTSQVEAGEMRSFDDLLNAKWKGRIGFLDPRNPGSGQNSWAFLWKIKGEEYLAKLAQQDLLITQNQRQIAEALAKGKLAFSIGLSHYSYEPFIKAGLPVKPVPNIKEGAHASNGSGVVTIVKNPPHPNATKIFVNWLLGKEGQEVYGKAMVQGTRRLDVDTKWLSSIGVHAAKDSLTLETYYKRQNHLQDAIEQYRRPAMEIARKLIP
jgi:iron(III) transport system substrate-binding protein